MKRIVYLFAASALLLGMVACFSTKVRIPVLTSAPKNVMQMMEGKKSVGVIAVRSKENFMQKLGIQIDWTKTIQGAVNNAFQKWGYYNMVDLESRREQLEQLAYSRTGMTTGAQSIGKQLNADGLLFITMTAPPLQECKIEKKFDAAAAAMAVIDAARGTGGNSEIKKDTGVLYLTVFVEARLVRTTTGQVVSFQNKDPFKLDNDVGNTQCPSVLDAFGKGMDMAGERIAGKLSPRVQMLAVPIATDPVGAPDNLAKKVEGYLKAGVKFIKNKPPNFGRAKEYWERALNESGQKSASAYWNLAVIKWAEADMEGADEYFKKAERAGGPEWLTDDKISITNKFTAERTQKDKEKDAE